MTFAQGQPAGGREPGITRAGFGARATGGRERQLTDEALIDIEASW